MQLHDMIDVAAQNGRFHVSGTDHVIRHEQELLVLDPAVGITDPGQFGDAAHGGVVL